MDLFHFIDRMASGPGFVLLGILTFLLGAGSILAPLWSPAAKVSAAAARFSPLWILAAFTLAVGCIVFLPFVNNTNGVVRAIQLGALALQVGVSGWATWRHRQWPWFVLPFALFLLGWQVILVGVIVLGSIVNH